MHTLSNPIVVFNDHSLPLVSEQRLLGKFDIFKLNNEIDLFN